MTPSFWWQYGGYCRLAMIIAVVVICVALSGCAPRTPHEPRLTPVVAKVPIAVSCVPSTIGPPPAYADAALPAGSAALVDRYRLRGVASEQRKARLAVVEPIIAACR